MKKIRLQLIRSPEHRGASVKSTIRGLGLRRIGSVSELEDTPSVRGMIHKVSYLLKVL